MSLELFLKLFCCYMRNFAVYNKIFFALIQCINSHGRRKENGFDIESLIAYLLSHVAENGSPSGGGSSYTVDKDTMYQCTKCILNILLICASWLLMFRGLLEVYVEDDKILRFKVHKNLTPLTVDWNQKFGLWYFVTVGAMFEHPC